MAAGDRLAQPGSSLGGRPPVGFDRTAHGVTVGHRVRLTVTRLVLGLQPAPLGPSELAFHARECNIAAMDEDGARLTHALCELAGLVLSAWAVDYATGGQVRETIRPLARRIKAAVWPWLRLGAMIVDALAGHGSATIAEAEEATRGR